MTEINLIYIGESSRVSAMSIQAVSITLTEDECIACELTVKARTVTQREVARARIILEAHVGRRNTSIAQELFLASHSVAVWRNRFAAAGIAGLINRRKTQTPIKYAAENQRSVVETAYTGSPESETHWSVRMLTKATGVGRERLRKILKDAHLCPHLLEMFTRSTDPAFHEKLIDDFVARK